MKKYYHQTFVNLLLSKRPLFVKTLDDQLNDFFNDHPNLTIVNIAYDQTTTDQGILISRTAFLTYSEEEE